MWGKGEEHYAAFWRAVQEMWLKLYQSKMVTVAAVNVRSCWRSAQLSGGGGSAHAACFGSGGCGGRGEQRVPEARLGASEACLCPLFPGLQPRGRLPDGRVVRLQGHG